jgi:hypothetical protein
MTENHNNDHVPPFVENQPQRKKPPSNREIQRQQASLATMVIGWIALTISMIGGAKMLYDILISGTGENGLLAKIIPLTLAFLMGWAVSVVSIRQLGNLILPMIVQYYMILVALGILFVYSRAIYKLYFEIPLNYINYSIALAAGISVLLGLHFLLEEHDLRPLAIPTLLGSLVHLAAMVSHYVFENGTPAYIGGDLYFFIIMLIISGLMLAHLGIFNGIRKFINGFFPPTTTEL